MLDKNSSEGLEHGSEFEMQNLKEKGGLLAWTESIPVISQQ